MGYEPRADNPTKNREHGIQAYAPLICIPEALHKVRVCNEVSQVPLVQYGITCENFYNIWIFAVMACYTTALSLLHYNVFLM